MKQLLQNLKTGVTEVVDVPAPPCRPGHVLIASRVSLVSAGTERMLVDFGNAGWIAKARSQPEKVRQVLDKIRTDGLLPTMEAVFNKRGTDSRASVRFGHGGRIRATGQRSPLS